MKSTVAETKDQISKKMIHQRLTIGYSLSSTSSLTSCIYMGALLLVGIQVQVRHNDCTLIMITAYQVDKVLHLLPILISTKFLQISVWWKYGGHTDINEIIEMYALIHKTKNVKNVIHEGIIRIDMNLLIYKTVGKTISTFRGFKIQNVCFRQNHIMNTDFLLSPRNICQCGPGPLRSMNFMFQNREAKKSYCIFLDIILVFF